MIDGKPHGQLAGYLARGYAEHRYLGENGDDFDTDSPGFWN